MSREALQVTDSICPRCDHRLVPVHKVEGRRRRVIALSCPEPYCDHVHYLPPEEVASYRRKPLAPVATPLPVEERQVS